MKSKADKNIENDHLRYVSIHKIQKTVVQKGRDRGKVIDAVFFSLNDGEKIHEMDKNKFAEFLLAFALYATPDKSLVEDRWVYKNEKLQPPVVNYLWKIFGLKSEHRISPDGFHIADKGKGLSFEIWDAKSTYDFSKGIMEKFTKYDKLASKFPMETTTCVFSIFGAPGYEYDKGEAASHREELQHLLQSSNKRKLRILDIRDFVVNEHKEIFRIGKKTLTGISLQRFRWNPILSRLDQTEPQNYVFRRRINSNHFITLDFEQNLLNNLVR